MSLQTIIDSKLNVLNNKDSDWVTFICDHIPQIKENANIVAIDDVVRDRYIYKFDHFLRDNNCNINIIWIAKLINRVNDYDDFTINNIIYIPSYNHIQQLYRIYKTSINLK